MKKNSFLLLVFIFLLPSYSHAQQLYLGITGDFGNNMRIASDDQVQNKISGSLGMNIFFDTKIKTNLYLKYGLSSGFVNSRVVVPSLGHFETIPIIGLFHISGNLALGKRIAIGKGFVDFYAGGGVSFYGGENNRGKYGPSSNSSVAFQFETYRANNNPKGFAQFLIQTKVTNSILLGISYQQHFTQALRGTYLLSTDKQHAISGDIVLIPACVSLQVAFKIANLCGNKE